MGVEPTKLTAWMVGCARMASTEVLSPWTTLKTPSGRPASLSISASRMEELGSRSQGLRTKVLPQAMAMGNIQSGTMAGKLKGVMPATTPSGWRMDQRVDAGADLLGVFAFEELRDAGGELDVFKAARGFALGVGEDFAVLAVDECGDFVDALLEDFAEAEEHACAAERWLRGPLGECGRGGSDGVVDFGVGGERDAGLHAARGGMEDIGEAAGGAGNFVAGDPMRDFGDVVRSGGGGQRRFDGGWHRRVSCRSKRLCYQPGYAFGCGGELLLEGQHGFPRVGGEARFPIGEVLTWKRGAGQVEVFPCERERDAEAERARGE